MKISISMKSSSDMLLYAAPKIYQKTEDLANCFFG